MPVYIQSANQISVQEPLSDEWFTNPVFYGEEKRVASKDPDFKAFLSPLMSRRMCSLLKRAVVLSRVTLKDAQIEMPDAIISGTGLGCIENTEKFLTSISENGEKFLQPTFFMQSTHNVLSSTVAIELKCHKYNNTFVHRGVSFENALLDAVMQIENRKANNVLLGGYDELTDDYYIFFNRLGTWDFHPAGEEKCFAAEASVSMALTNTKNEDTLCKIDGAELLYRPAAAQIRQSVERLLEKASCKLSDIDAVLTGFNTIPANDAVYNDFIYNVFGASSLPKAVHYKHVFGESWSAPALGVYAAAKCLKKNVVPHFMAGSDDDMKNVKRILFYNHYKNKSHSLILLSSC